VVKAGALLDHPERLEVEENCHRALGIQLPIKWYIYNLSLMIVPELNLLQGAAIPVQNPVKGGVTSPEISGNPSGEGGAVKSAVTEGSVEGITILHSQYLYFSNNFFSVCNLRKKIENLNYWNLLKM